MTTALEDILSNPHDSVGWSGLLTENAERLGVYLSFLSRSYPALDYADLEDIRQTALMRIVLESHRIAHVEAYWEYWKRIIRSTLMDYLRVRQRSSRSIQRGVDGEAGVDPEAWAFELSEELSTYAMGCTPLAREVLKDLLNGRGPRSTAVRLGTSVDTIYVVRSKIRRDINELLRI